MEGGGFRVTCFVFRISSFGFRGGQSRFSGFGLAMYLNIVMPGIYAEVSVKTCQLEVCKVEEDGVDVERGLVWVLGFRVSVEG